MKQTDNPKQNKSKSMPKDVEKVKPEAKKRKSRLDSIMGEIRKGR